MRAAISRAGISTKSGYQIPAMSKVDNAILVDPTILRVRSLR